MRRLTVGLALLPILGGAVAGCQGDDPEPAARYDECGANLATDPKIGGPLDTATGLLVFEMNEHLRSADVAMFTLSVPEGETVVIDHVQFEDYEGYAPLRLLKTFVVDHDTGEGLTQTPIGAYRRACSH